MAVCVVTVLLEAGITEFVMSSTGNSSTAVINEIERHDGRLACHVFAPAKLAHRIRCRNAYMNLHVVDSDFVATGKAAKSFAFDSGLHWEGGFFNYARREGLKTAFIE